MIKAITKNAAKINCPLLNILNVYLTPKIRKFRFIFQHK